MKEIIKELNMASEVSDALILKCSDRCIDKSNALDGILKLKEAAEGCVTKEDYINFFCNVLKLNAEVSERGLILHLNKIVCSCPIAANLTIDKSRLCDCTKEHEKKMWSAFFGKEIDVEILESFWRGGSDCVLEIIL